MKKTTRIIPNVKKIAVLRAIALGDFIIALPALHALRDTYPDAEITLLTRPWNVEFAQNRPFPFDRVIAVPPSQGVYDGPGITEDKKKLNVFFKEMQKEQYDIAIQLHGGGRNSNPFVQKLGAKITVGIATPDAPKLDRWIPYIFYQHEVHRYLETVALVGAQVQMIEPHIKVLPRDLEEVHKKIPKLTKPYVIVHPGASDPRRHWGSLNYAQVADEIAKKGYNIVITGTGNEKNIIEEVILRMQERPILAYETLSLHGLTGLLSQADLFVGNDTGPLHLARSVSTPTVGIYWFPNLVNWGPITRTWHRTACSYLINCPICGFDYMKDEFTLSYQHGDCGHTTSLVAQIPVDEVLYKAFELLDMKKRSSKQI